MTTILDAVKAAIPPDRLAVPASHVGAYAFMTTVRSWKLGISMTLTDERIFPTSCKSSVKNMGKVEELPMAELLSWTSSLQPIERSIGIAALNSIIPFAQQPYFKGNALELTARLGAGKKVVIIGHFPHLEKIRETAKSFQILEKRPQPGDLPSEEAPNVVPEADVVAMTGVTCMNDTVEGILALKKPGAIFIIVGPTVPMSPVLFDYGVDIIGGAWIHDESLALPMIAQGSTTRLLKGISSVLMPKDPHILSDYEEIEPPVEVPNPNCV